MAGIREDVSLTVKFTDVEQTFIALIFWRNCGVWTIWQRNHDNVFDDSKFSIRNSRENPCDSDDDVVLCTPGIYDRSKREVIASVFMRVEI